jgi:proteasome accessory factor A
MIEDDFLTADLTLEHPVTSLHEVSHDPSLKHLLTLKSGRKLTAIQLQMEYLENARKYVEDRTGADTDPQTRDVLDRWESVLTRLESDPMSLNRELDWVAKLSVLQQYRDRDGLDWSHPKLQLVDLQYADLRPERGLYTRFAERGRMERLLSEDDIVAAVQRPPDDTRAYFRGRCLAQYAEHGVPYPAGANDTLPGIQSSV